ncbi:tRNA-guanine(15) transglycosylase-like protein [Vararia minispora EC-137]|uniref:tRNA-guanine(15) transglycosylase-like protein n=1 Tax=Vararia minispora EC-137 TaxID=1314806 RepID=A0ACB8R074_9AGAM|nr:tRNA-guanine(15) transglycosylase-like protein [Vararia minispora EC-137]
MSHTKHTSSLRFRLHDRASETTKIFSPRLGAASLHRPGSADIEVQTPGILTSTVRGLVPHLARDTMRATQAIRWVNVPFESFLEHTPPILTLQNGPHPLHRILGFLPERHIVSMVLRDPSDDREMPPNGKDFVSANCIRGMTVSDWRNHAITCEPDVILALSDIPFTAGGLSQKRLTKSIERSAAWLADILKPVDMDDISATRPRLNVLVHMAGGSVLAARKEFAYSLLETPLDGEEASAIRPYKILDDGVSGYAFDLVPLHKAFSDPPSLDSVPLSKVSVRRTAMELSPAFNIPTPEATAKLVPLLRASLEILPPTKLRIAHSAGSPHEMLYLVRDVGIDIFDAHWAQRAADIGIALDFTFPAPITVDKNGRDIGHNMYDARYAHDFSQFADSFAEQTSEDSLAPSSRCSCLACSPMPPPSALRHSTIDEPVPTRQMKPNTRAYLHHLLHTHEMGANVLLAAHNLSVLDAFFAGIRSVLSSRPDDFAREVERFAHVYDGELKIFMLARKAWADVELARGKGRLAREKEKQAQGTLGTAVELD